MHLAWIVHGTRGRKTGTEIKRRTRLPPVRRFSWSTF